MVVLTASRVYVKVGCEQGTAATRITPTLSGTLYESTEFFKVVRDCWIDRPASGTLDEDFDCNSCRIPLSLRVLSRSAVWRIRLAGIGSGFALLGISVVSLWLVLRFTDVGNRSGLIAAIPLLLAVPGLVGLRRLWLTFTTREFEVAIHLDNKEPGRLHRLLKN